MGGGRGRRGGSYGGWRLLESSEAVRKAPSAGAGRELVFSPKPSRRKECYSGGPVTCRRQWSDGVASDGMVGGPVSLPPRSLLAPFARAQRARVRTARPHQWETE